MGWDLLHIEFPRYGWIHFPEAEAARVERDQARRVLRAGAAAAAAPLADGGGDSSSGLETEEHIMPDGK